MRFYKQNGVWQSWDYLHNELGYAEHATRPTVFKSCADATWGESAGSGYFDGDQTDMVNGSFWSDEDNTAWHTLNSLVLNVEVYPADATDCAMEKDGVQSDAVSIESDGVTYYLIRNIWDSGWMSADEAAAEGWEPAQPGPVLPVVYTHTGTQTAASIAPDASFDTGLTYDSNNLYIGETDDGLGDVTRYGWEAEEGPEPPAYTEITLYMQSGNKKAQSGVTSSYKGDVNSTYCYQLYTDEDCTIPWNGYDYSNDYEFVYNGVVIGIQKVSDLPSTTVTSGAKIAYILMDIGCLWLACNMTGSGYTQISFTSLTLRIYPKEQQYYAAYVYGSGTYKNVQLAKNTSKICASKPGSTQYIQTPHQFPVITLRKILGAAGNELTLSEFSTYVGQDDSRFRIINKTNAPEVRTVVYTLEYPTFYHWLKSDGTDITTSSGVSYPVMNLGGEIIEFDNAYDYFPIGLIRYNGNWASSTYSYLNNATMGAFDPDHPTWLCFKQVSGSLSMSCVWYYKKLKPIEVNFGDPVTIPAGYTVESVKCSRGYAFASNVSSESSIMGQFVHYELSGEKVYFDETNTALVGVGVAPALQIFALIGLNNSGYYVSTKSGTSASHLTSASASYLNSDGYFVKGSATYDDSTVMNSVASAMQTFPVYFNLSDSSGNWLYFCFRVPQTLWQFQNGTFSWLGDTTDASDLAYWYNGRAVQINLRPITT